MGLKETVSKYVENIKDWMDGVLGKEPPSEQEVLFKQRVEEAGGIDAYLEQQREARETFRKRLIEQRDAGMQEQVKASSQTPSGRPNDLSVQNPEAIRTRKPDDIRFL